MTYTPAANYNGPDSFTFRVSDGAAFSNTATVSITVTAVNDPPAANPQSVATPEDTPRSITLTGSDPDGDPLSFAIGTPPAHGTLTGTPPNVTYTPAADYTGPDSFTFTVNDGTVTSAPATVSITVTLGQRPAGRQPAGGDDARGHPEGDHADRERSRRGSADLLDRDGSGTRNAHRDAAQRDVHARPRTTTGRTASPSR